MSTSSYDSRSSSDCTSGNRNTSGRMKEDKSVDTHNGGIDEERVREMINEVRKELGIVIHEPLSSIHEIHLKDKIRKEEKRRKKIERGLIVTHCNDNTINNDDDDDGVYPGCSRAEEIPVLIKYTNSGSTSEDDDIDVVLIGEMDTVCCLCLDSIATCKAQPCRHKVTCKPCSKAYLKARKLMPNNKDRLPCVYCRQYLSNFEYETTRVRGVLDDAKMRQYEVYGRLKSAHIRRKQIAAAVEGAQPPLHLGSFEDRPAPFTILH